MDRVIVAVDPGVGIEPKAFAVAWNEDPELAASAVASVEPAGQGTFLPGLVEFVVLPFVVNMVAAVLYERIQRALEKARRPREVIDVHIEEHTFPTGERVVVIRTRREIG